MNDGKWQESLSLATKSQHMLDRGGADEKDKRRAAELQETACARNEASLARSKGITALEEGGILTF